MEGEIVILITKVPDRAPVITAVNELAKEILETKGSGTFTWGEVVQLEKLGYTITSNMDLTTVDYTPSSNKLH